MTARRAGLALLGLLAGLGLLAVPAAAQTTPAGDAPPRHVLAQDSGPTLSGTLRAGNETIPGVSVTVTSDGEQIGQVTTGEDGRWEVRVPGPGTYEVRLDQDTLPEGVGLPDPAQAVAEVSFQEGERPPAPLFPLSEAEDAGPSFAGLRRLLDLTFSGIQLGAVIAITSLGLSLIFGVTGLINFAHGEMVTFGAVAALFMNAAGGLLDVHVIPATLLAVLLGGALGWAFERGVFGPLRERNAGLLALLVVSIGLSIIFRYGILGVYGGGSSVYRDYASQGPFRLGPLTTTPLDLVVTVLSLFVLIGTGLLLTRTKLGTAIRAVADNRDLAESSGIDVEYITLAVWVAAGGLAALGGVFQGLTQGVTFDMGFRLLLLMFAGVILGGLGTAYGAMVGGLFVGIAVQVSTLWFSVELKQVFAFGLLILVLLVRPQGILGRRERIG